ncbi:MULTISPECIES: hypothetical protein [unclassified Exiguobacterium]|uniref:hypothetical protein n=1 Tax=unclassified Exiguobacterium TaxID=2644629 RepID=UPI002036E9E9|nr:MULTISPECIES: hypothetical protein [unclassified Exiguobacterium]
MNTFPNAIQYYRMVELFEKANRNFLNDHLMLLKSRISERAMCGQLQIMLNDLLREDSDYKGYYVDVEYNRNVGRRIKRIRNDRYEEVDITCDLIVHSRGKDSEQDNLIAIEMKKVEQRSSKQQIEIAKDKERLRALTRPSYGKDWRYDGENLPDFVCRFILGVYYEINYINRQIYIEYYRSGEIVDDTFIDFDKIGL